MKVLFLNPSFKEKFSRTSRSPAVTRGGTIYFPFWLAYAVGVLDKENKEKKIFDIKVIDGPAEKLSKEETIKQIVNFTPELLVVDTSTPSIYSDIKNAEKIKELLPDTFIILVGTHPSAVPEETLKLSDKIDAVTKGEYDYTIKDLAYCLLNKGNLASVNGVIFQKNKKIIFNPPRDLIENLDDLPFASEIYKKHFKIKNYFFAASDYPMVMIITGRGCPFRCFFCLYPQTFHSRRYRLRSAESVVKEFEYIKNNLPEVKEIGIEDDTFTADQERVIKICKLLIEKKIKLKWYCNVRANLNLETMQWMKKAGCHLLTIGFESGNQKLLNNIKKGITVEQIRQFVKDSKKAKLLVHGCFIIGNPEETKETMNETLALAKELNCDSMQFYPLIPYPGTEAFAWAKENGYLITDKYNEWLKDDGTYNCVLNLPEVKREDILNFCDKATKEYYLRSAYILMKLKQVITHPKEIKRLLIAAKTFFKYLK
ncbi:radical SAM protein [Candidatus Parcubacteria bacterium]|nr:radical SAM protein [Candidatus Parcubacteria bacterium]